MSLSESKQTESFGLENPINCKDIFMDTTCVKANIHFPVDWVLLRDAVRSLLLAIKTIRAQGLKHRMIEPYIFLKKMNALSIEMTHTRRRKDSKKQRKRILREMKKLSRCIEKHGVRYRQLLIDHREETDWTEAQANLVIKRIDNILDQLPAAISQAHERIIEERKVSVKEKILSLYEPDAHVIVRGKTGNEVEFGNGLLITEQADGIIVAWELYKDQPPSDSKLVDGIINRIEKTYGHIHSVCADRGFHSKSNEDILKQHEIYDAMCPRSPQKLKERVQKKELVSLQTRRGQTEARIGIFKNVFLGRPLRSKGFVNKQLSVSFCVLTHNLWVIARMALADEQSALQIAA